VTQTQEHVDLAAHDRPRSPWVVFGLTSVAVFIVSLDATIVLAAFPALRESFASTPPSELSWVLNAYTIVYAALLVPGGRLADALGRRRVFLTGVFLFGLASLLSGLAWSVAALIAFRALQAVGAALLTPASLALVLEAFPIEKRSLAVGLWGAVGALAAAFGPATGSWLVEWGSWPSIFFVNVPIVAWALWRGNALLAETRGYLGAARPDLLGALLLIAGVAALVLGIVQASTWPASSVLASSAAGLALLGAFVRWAHGRESAALDLRLFENTNYRWVSVATLTFGAAFTMMFLSFFLFLTGVWGYRLSEAGLAVTPGPLTVIPMAFVAGRIAPRVGHRPLLVAGALLFSSSQIWFFGRLQATPDFLGVWLPGLVVGGSGVGLALPSLTGAAVSDLGSATFGVGTAVNSALRQIGSALGAATTVLIVGNASSGLSAFRTAYVMMAVAGLLTAALCLRIDTRSSRPT
jgi:EmrB/QacA subfamily drug resistance transporter